MASVLDDGFEMSNIWYTEPKTLQTAFNVMGDVIINTTAMQYGGFTVPEVDTVLAKYAKKSYDMYYDEYLEIKGKEYKEEAERLCLDVRLCGSVNKGIKGLSIN